ncbi:hypothetical protein BH23BAC1_BH23BAC1_34820 [soil metagenome]
MKKFLVCAFAGVLLSSCEIELDNWFDLQSWITYHIKAGKHLSTLQLATFDGTELRFLAEFNNSAIYQTKDTVNQGDINKLMGFSDCNSQHHGNSARFGWSWDDYHQQLKIYAYAYKDGTIQKKYIKPVELNTIYEYRIRIERRKYQFILDGEMVELGRGCTNTRGMLRYYLFPYFGGDEKAPHDITIRIKELKNGASN